MICLTGDVHNQHPRSLDQQAVGPATESDLAHEYLRIATHNGVRATLFVTGRLAVEDGRTIRQLAKFPGEVELGGHDFDPFHGVLWRRVWHKLFGFSHGLPAFQWREIVRTRAALQALGILATAWRAHAYRQDRFTFELLRKAGFTHVSNTVDPSALAPWAHHGLIVVPINTLPDHDHVIHRRRIPPSSSPTPLTGPSWLKVIEKQIAQIQATGGVATLQVHPVCMAALDDFETFRELCSLLGRFPTTTISALRAFGQRRERRHRARGRLGPRR